MTCPNDDELIGLLRGTLSSEHFDEIVAHVDECDACKRMVHSLARRVPVRIVTSPERAEGSFADETDCQELLAKIEVLNDLVETAPVTADTTYADTAPLPKLDGYEVEEVLGRGGMGVVLKAWEVALRRHVAVKVLSPRLAANRVAHARFLNEARSAAAIRHPNVVPIFSVESEHSPPFLVLELVEGRTLADLLSETRRLSVDEVVRLASDIAEGLAAAHDRGIVHRDVKPGNILIDETDERARLTDFGLARACGDENDFTSESEVVGTPHYMSPEQVQGQRVDTRSDLFSLGVILYRMLTGENPFGGTSLIALARQICDHDSPPVSAIASDCPEWLESLVSCLMAKDPQDRIQSTEEVLGIIRRRRFGTVRNAENGVGQTRSRYMMTFGLGFTIMAIALGSWFTRPAVENKSPIPASEDHVPLSSGPDKTPARHLMVDSKLPLRELAGADAAIADMDSDGDLDVVVANGKFGNPQPNLLWLNDGQGRFELAQEFGNAISGGVALADVDGDGNVDAFVANWSDDARAEWGEDRLWMNDGEGRLKQSEQSFGNIDGRHAEFADVDGDGDPDLWVCNYYEPDVLWLNEDGQFRRSDQELAGMTSSMVTFGDLNGDQVPDAVVACSVGATIWINDGSGTFKQTKEVGKRGAFEVQLADLNRDGRLDATIGHDDGVGIYLNSGEGVLVDSGVLCPLERGNALAVGDLNGDGLPDLMIGSGRTADAVIALNDGGGRFSPPEAIAAIPYVARVRLADFDNDGDLDVFFANGHTREPRQSDRVLWNQLKQQRSRELPD